MFSAKPPTASHIYRKPKSCSRYWSNFLLFCRCARLLEVWQKSRVRFVILLLFFLLFWNFLLNALYKSALFYMIRSWRVPMIVTSHFPTYESIILSKNLNNKKKLTGWVTPTVLCLLLHKNCCGSSNFLNGNKDETFLCSVSLSLANGIWIAL